MRATNITNVFGLTSMMMVRFAFADRQFKLTPEVELPKVARELAERGAPKPSEKSCGRLSGVVLREAHVELASLTALMAEYAHLLPRRNGELALEEPEALTLIERLQEQARGFKHIRGLAAQILSAIVSRVSLAVTEAEVSRRLDAAVDLTADDMLSGDYGRFSTRRPCTSSITRTGRPPPASMRRSPCSSRPLPSSPPPTKPGRTWR
jgi:hypothetical protein